MDLTTRNRNVISGLIALVLLFSAITIGVSASFGAFDDTYILKGSFDTAGQGLQKNSDIKIRGVNVGKVAKVDLVDNRALVTMDINSSNKIPLTATATVRDKTLFGEKFVDIAPGAGEASGPFYSKKGELLDKCDKSAQPSHSCTIGGFELEQVLADAYPLLKQINPADLMTVIHTLADAGRDLGPNINRQIANTKTVLDVNAAHDADTRQFLADLAKLSQQLGVRADDLVKAADDLNIALPTINGRADSLNTLLVQTARLSNDVADLLRNNKDFIDKSFGGGQEVLNVLFDHRNDIVPLVIGLREYLQSLTELTRIPTGDGTLMAAVKSLTCPPSGPLPPLVGCQQGVASASASQLSANNASPSVDNGGSSSAAASDPTGVQQLLDALAKVGCIVIRTAIKFGIFVLVCLSFTTYLAFTIGNISLSDPFARDYYTLNANFDDVTGLLPNDNVKIAGVVVGKVKSISVVDGRARVSFSVKKNISLGQDTTAAVRWRNLIGQRYVYLYPGRDTVTRLVDGKDIKSTESVVDLGELFNRLGPIVGSLDSKQINDFLDTVTQALDGNQDKLSKAIDDLGTLMKGLGTRDASIGRLVDNLNTVAGVITNRDQQIRVMLDNLVLISSTFSANTQTLDTALKEFGDFSTNLHAILSNNAAEIDRIISNLDLISTDVIGPKLAELDHALKGIDQASRVVFDSSRLGEWLNQAILCFNPGPPGPTTVCHQPPGEVLPASAPNIGGLAPSRGAGSNALQTLLVRNAE